jgi:hypothetical protein
MYVDECVFDLGLGFHLNISQIQYLIYAAECVFNFSSPWINVASHVRSTSPPFFFLYAKFTYLKNNAFSVFSKSIRDVKLQSIAMGGFCQHAGVQLAFEYKNTGRRIGANGQPFQQANQLSLWKSPYKAKNYLTQRFIRKHVGRENMNEKTHVTPFECRKILS